MSLKQEYKHINAYTDQLLNELTITDFPRLMQKIAVQRYANDNQFCLNKEQGYDALILIDVQKEFCDVSKARGNIDTENTCKRIASLVPKFRAVQLPIYSVFYAQEDTPPSEVDFHHYLYKKTDIPIRKTENSAFRDVGDKNGDNRFFEILNKNSHKNLLVMGFNATACVLETVKDGQFYGYNCTLVTDWISDGTGYGFGDMAPDLKNAARKNGVKFIPSEYALDVVRKHRTKPRLTPHNV